ncbi:MAG: glycerophosphodiester phosphodiesterase family protein [Limisphaerales bacterium]
MAKTVSMLAGGALGVIRRAWLQLAVTDLMARAVAVVLLTPLVGLLLQVFLMTTSEGVLTDEAIAVFLLHPTGILAFLMVASVVLAILFIESGQLMVVAYGEVSGSRVTWLDACLYALRHARDLLATAGQAVVRLLWIAAPPLAIIGVLCVVFLQEHDINYYLDRKPPVFLVVAGASGLLGFIGLARVLWQLAGWILVLPLVLFEGVEGRKALSMSLHIVGGHRWSVLLALLVYLVGCVLLFALLGVVIALMGNLLIPHADAGGFDLLLTLVGLLTFAGMGNLAVSVLITIFLPVCVVEFYKSLRSGGKLDLEAIEVGRQAPPRMPGKSALWSAFAIVLLILLGGYSLLRYQDPEDDTIIIAHRGGAAVAPENTMAAFRQGLDDGADWLELDVQEDSAGQIVVIHDRDLMRVGGASLEVAEASMRELEQIDIGSYFDPSFSGERVPTLEEVLLLARGRAGLFIELKYYGRQRQLEERVIRLVEATNMATNVVLMSLKYEGIQKAGLLRPGWTRGLLNAVAVGDVTRLEVDFLALTAKASTRYLIARAHARGLKVYAWTVNDPVQMSVMISRGVDGLITDDVAMARKVIEVREQLSPVGRFLLWLAGEAGLLKGVHTSSGADDA